MAPRVERDTALGPGHRRAGRGRALTGVPHVVVERPHAGLGHGPPAFKTQLFRFVDVFPALPATPTWPATSASTSTASRSRKALDLGVGVADRVRSASGSRRGWPGATSCGWPSSSSSGATPDEAVAGLARGCGSGQRLHRRPPRREDRRRRRGRPLRRAGRRAGRPRWPTPRRRGRPTTPRA